MKTYIHVNRHVIDANRKDGTDLPALVWKRGKRGKSNLARTIKILGPSEFVYSPHEPVLPCGARVVVITESPIEVTQ